MSISNDPSDARAVIVVVDDSAANRRTMRVCLEGLSYPIVEASSGPEALRLLLSREVAVLLLDVQMPGMDGYETARLIRSRPRTQSVPIIFVTGYDRDDQEVLDAYRLGAVDFLFKPVRPEVIRAKVSTFIELHERAAEGAAQAERLRQHERAQHLQELAAQRRQLEADALRRQMDEQKRINERLEDADRRKNEFLAILGHELRNPLVPLTAGLELLSRRGTSDQAGETIAAMRRQVAHLVRLIDDLLDVSRIAANEISLITSPITLEQVVDEAVAMSAPAIADRGLDLEVASRGDAVWLRADPVRLSQAVSNLLNNAARYTDPPGQITLVHGHDGDGAVVRVTDTGRGMDAATLQRAFGLFVQGQPGGGGLGVGLALARRLAELHGGTLVGRSPGPGQGSTFEIHLPVIEAPRSGVCSGPPGEGEREEEFFKPLRIVVIEDSFDIRDSMRELLQDWGHDVELAANGSDGLELVRQTHPDVALVDIGLPDIDGYEVAQRLRTDLGDGLRIIAITGFGQEADRSRAFSAGFDAHLTKPPCVDSLRRALAG